MSMVFILFPTSSQLQMPNVMSGSFPGMLNDQYKKLGLFMRQAKCSLFEEFYNTKTTTTGTKLNRFLETWDYFYNQERSKNIDNFVKEAKRKV